MLTEAQRKEMTGRLRRKRAATSGGIARRPEGTTELPLSFGQEQLWFLDKFAPGSSTYNVPLGIRLCGPLDVEALRRALDGLVARHEALRTRLVSGADGRPAQVVDAPAAVALPVHELSGADREARLKELAEAEVARPFVLAEGPLFRARLVRLAAQEHVLVVVAHHSVYDGWSVGVTLAELTALYQAEVTGEPAELPELPVQFADYALWERERLRGPVLDELVDYWRTTLDGFATVQMPTDRPRPVVMSHEGGIERLNIGGEVLEAFRELARTEGTTLFVAMLAALQVLLHRYTGQDDIVVGTVSANRGRAKLAPLIGFLVNTLAIRTDLSGDPAFTELMGRVRETTVGAYAHQDLPFAKLVEALRVERDPSRAPVFQIGMSVAEAPAEVEAGGLTMRLELVDLMAAKFDLNFFAEVRGGQMWIGLSYATALFDTATIRRLLDHFRVLLEGIAKDPGLPLSRLPILTDAEVHRELVEWNDTAADLPVMSVHEGFERQVQRTPDGVAAEMDGETVTYARLNADANRIARRLRDLGVRSETLVGVSMTTSTRRLAVLLGIMKAGAGYVPLDPALPAERLSYMIDDAGMPVVVADETGAAALPDTAARTLRLDTEWPEISAMDGENPGLEVDLAHVAYVIYTSGSTGRPKGVVVEHRNVSNFLAGMIEYWGIGPEDRVLQFASYSFDASVMDMFMTLQAGARAVLAARDTLHSPPRLAQLMRDTKVTFACLTPSVMRLLSGESLPDLRIFMAGGEEMPSELAVEWARPGLRFVNEYGPTETTVGILTAELDGTVLPPPIGRPKQNCTAYVLDARLNPVPVGVVGELHLGGLSVTRGYLNAPELTARKFVSDPFSTRPAARLYKSGDLVRRLPDGNIVYVGRVDGQVKIRGLRLELGEIEAALVAHPAVAQAVIVVAPDRSGTAGGRQLVGYVRLHPDSPSEEVGGGAGVSTAGLGASVAAEPCPEGSPGVGVGTADLRQHLAQRLPGYMVPTHLLVVESFTLNNSGKIDKRALPAVDAPESIGYVAPRTRIETALAGMYAGLLGQDQVGVDDGFFDLGGNSLQAMQLISQIHTELAVDVGVTTVFLAPSVRQLAARIERAGGATARSGLLVELSETDGGVPLFVVHAVGGTVHAYAPLAGELAGSFTVYGIEAAGIGARSVPVESSLDDLVTTYTAAIRAVQAEGPYWVAGWSMGGVLAFEIARRLEHDGAEVAFLGLLDAPFDMSGRSAGTEEELTAEFVADAARTLGWQVPDVTDRLAWLAERLDADAGNLEAVRTQIDRRFEVFKGHIRAIAGYRPHGTVRADTLIATAVGSPNAAAGPHWAGILEGQVSTMSMDGDHYTFLRPPGVQELSAQLLKAVE